MFRNSLPLLPSPELCPRRKQIGSWAEHIIAKWSCADCGCSRLVVQILQEKNRSWRWRCPVSLPPFSTVLCISPPFMHPLFSTASYLLDRISMMWNERGREAEHESMPRRVELITYVFGPSPPRPLPAVPFSWLQQRLYI